MAVPDASYIAHTTPSRLPRRDQDAQVPTTPLSACDTLTCGRRNQHDHDRQPAVQDRGGCVQHATVATHHNGAAAQDVLFPKQNTYGTDLHNFAHHNFDAQLDTLSRRPDRGMTIFDASDNEDDVGAAMKTVKTGRGKLRHMRRALGPTLTHTRWSSTELRHKHCLIIAKPQPSRCVEGRHVARAQIRRTATA